MALVYFRCNCGKSLAVDDSDVGRQIQCSGCGHPLLVPSPELYWTCSCGEEMSAPKNIEGGLVKCAACAAQHTVPIRLGLKRDAKPQVAPSFDVPRVPVGRTNEIRCSKCGYMSPPILTLCPQCQNHLHKGAVIRRQCIAVAKALLIISLGWFLAAHFSSISDFVKGLFGIETKQVVLPVESLSNSGNVIKASAAGVPTAK